jgi:hypothetical protein
MSEDREIHPMELAMRMAKAEGFKTVGSGLYSWIAGRTHNGYQEVIYFSDDVTRAVKRSILAGWRVGRGSIGIRCGW